MRRRRDDLAVYFGFKDPDPPVDPVEARQRARKAFKSPWSWLILIGWSAGVGALYEALGDGDFDLGAASVAAAMGLAVLVFLQAFEALWPPD